VGTGSSVGLLVLVGFSRAEKQLWDPAGTSITQKENEHAKRVLSLTEWMATTKNKVIDIRMID